MKEIYDVIIIGAGPAGLTAGIYAARRNLKAVIIGKVLGGQTATTPNIENYPGFESVEGLDLSKKMEKQVRSLGVDIFFEEVTKISPIKIGKDEKGIVVGTDKKKYNSKTVILAFGKTPRTLGVPGEKEFAGKGITYCVTCDAPLFKNKTVAVIGGGNSAMDAALLLSGIAKKVYIIHRRQELRAFEMVISRVRKKKNVEFILDTVVKEIKGNKLVSSITIENVKTKKTKELKVEGVIVEIGSIVQTELIKDLVRIDENGYVEITNNCETFYPDTDKVNIGKIRPGVFAAGDLTMTPYKQIVVAAGQGAIAALQAYHYIHGTDPHKFVVDWGKKQ